MRKRETFGCYNSLLMSDLGLVNQKAIWSNCMRINIEMFEELFSLVETKSLPCTTSYIIISDHKLN